MNDERLVACLTKYADSQETIQAVRKAIVGLAVAGRLDDRSPSEFADTLDEVIGGSGHASKNAVAKAKSLGNKFETTDLPHPSLIPGRFVRLGDIAKIEKGKTGIKQARSGPYPLVVTASDRGSCDHYDFDGAAAIIPLVSSTGHGKASLHRVHYQEGKFALGSILAAVLPRSPEQISARFLYEYLSAFKEELLVSQMIGTANVSLTVKKISEVPVPIVSRMAQLTVDELMALCDSLEAEREKREATRDRLTTASLGRLTAPDVDEKQFKAHADFAIKVLPELTTRPDQIKVLRQTILGLAVRGKLVEQDPNDEPASELLRRIVAEKERLKRQTGDRRIRLARKANVEDYPCELPQGWEVQSFENLFLFIDYRGKTPPKIADGVPLITAKNVRMGVLNREPREFIAAPTYHAWMVRGFPRLGDLLFTTEAPLANVCINDMTEPFALAQRVICLRPYGEVNTRFIMFALMSNVIQGLIEKHATGMTAKGIKAAKLKPLTLPIPPLREQRRIVAKVDELMRLCDSLERNFASGQAIEGRLLTGLLSSALNLCSPDPFGVQHAHYDNPYSPRKWPEQNG